MKLRSERDGGALIPDEAAPPPLLALPDRPAAIQLIATGRRAELAQDSEVIVLGYCSPGERLSVPLEQLVHDGNWEIKNGLRVGEADVDCGLVGSSGILTLPALAGAQLALLRHGWSGIAELHDQRQRHILDLFSDATEIIIVDLESGSARVGDVLEVIEWQRQSRRAPEAEREPENSTFLRAGGEPAAQPVLKNPIPAKDSVAGDDIQRVTIRAVGEKSGDAESTEVIILAAEPWGHGLPSDLSCLVAGGNWEIVNDLYSCGRSWRTVLKATEAQITIPAQPGGRIFLLMHAWSGFVEIEGPAHTFRIDLYAREPRLMEFNLSRVLLRPVHIKRVVEDSVRSTPRYLHYQRLLSQIDASKPLALYLPRWRGVATSTLNLFSQTLAIPPTAAGHPSDITAEDIDFYAKILIESNVKHFVVSGGDTFWLRLIQQVQKDVPDARFDVLWHSNYLQMGEEHDWNLLRHWLRALEDGWVTRIAVVKRGLDKFFRQMGLDSVFIPNIIASDPAAIEYAGMVRKAGIWLSGSSTYRKMPHASLIAVTMMQDVALVGAGFDAPAMAMVARLGLRHERLWQEPLPQRMLHKNIGRTGVTLYVTLSECSPMLPLESMHLGVPCVVGPSSHLFRDHAYLSQSLIVQEPLSPVSIRNHAEIALAEGAQIIEAFKVYAAEEQALAREGVARLLD